MDFSIKPKRVTLKYLEQFVIHTLKEKFEIEVNSVVASRTYARGHDIEAGAAQIHLYVKIKGNEDHPFSIYCMHSCSQIITDMDRWGYTHLKIQPNGMSLSDATIELTR